MDVGVPSSEWRNTPLSGTPRAAVFDLSPLRTRGQYTRQRYLAKSVDVGVPSSDWRNTRLSRISRATVIDLSPLRTNRQYARW